MFKVSSPSTYKCDYTYVDKKTCNGSNIGSFNHLRYDLCDYNKRIQESVNPCSYQLYFGAYENCKKCRDEHFWRRFDVVDVESDLLNINRPASRCPQFKYNKNCGSSPYCVSTFAPNAPRIYDANVCPIVFNNISKLTSNMLPNIDTNICSNIKFSPFKLN